MASKSWRRAFFDRKIKKYQRDTKLLLISRVKKGESIKSVALELRRFIPKGMNITKISEKYIKEIEDWINNLPRAMFGYKTSLEVA